MDAFEFVKETVFPQLWYVNLNTKIRKVIEVNNKSVLHVEPMTFPFATNVLIISIFLYGCIWTKIVLGSSQLWYNEFK